MIKSYRKKPVVIEAVEWSGDNFAEVHSFTKSQSEMVDGELVIFTLEDGINKTAKHVATVGDMVIRGIQGEFYFCKPDIFNETYSEIF